jgi:hypothetical protein
VLGSNVEALDVDGRLDGPQAALEQAAQRGVCVFDSAEEALACFQRLDGALTLLSLRAFASQARGEDGAAWTDVLLIGRLADLNRHPSVGCRALRNRATIRVAGLVSMLAQRSRPEAAMNAQLDRLLERLEDPEGLPLAVRDRVQSLLEGYYQGPPTDEQALLRERDRALFALYGADRVRQAASPTARRARRGSKVRLSDELEQVRDRNEYPLCQIILRGDLEQIVLADLEARAHLRLTRCLLALLDGGPLPITHPAPLPDPFSGKPLRWQQHDQVSGLLWSVGPDGVNDHGQSSPFLGARGRGRGGATSDLALQVNLRQ